MATFFHGPSEIEADGLQTLYLMNPGYVGYSDAQTPAAAANMVFLNSAGHHPLTNATLAHHQQPPAPATQNHQHFVGIPLQPTTAGDPTRPTVHHASQHEISGAVHGFIPRLHYNLWTSTDPNSTTATGTHQDHQAQAIPTTGNSSVSVSDLQSQLGISRSLQQGLSLSLSSQQPAYGQYRAESEIPAPAPAPVISPTSGEDMRVSGGSSSSASGVSNGTSGIQSVFLGSKYLKAAQQLLDEVVNVGNGIKAELSKGSKDQSKISREATVVAEEASNGGGEGEAATAKRGGAADLTTAEKQELQMKKAKLVSMLDEVEQRYRQYHHQMQIVVSSFEQAAGLGSAKTYTALALQTISKQFRCLKDAISGQIRATSKSLGEEDYLGGGKGEGSRLRFVDHQLRQQRALQQLGMIQHNAWRPQRGLPERSVSILRAWLFEHFLHPYPKDSDKLMLAKQTGLTRSQVSNWFINARVRLWKPMVEEMYMEETKNEEQNGMDDKASKNELNEESGSRSTAHQENSPTRTDQTRNNPNPKQDSSIDPNAVPPSSINSNVTTVPSSTMEANMRRNMEANMRPQASFFLMRSPESESNMVQGNSKKSRNTTTELEDSPSSIHSMSMDMKPSETNREMCMKFEIERQNRNGYLGGGGGGGGGGFGAYSIGEIGRFDPEQFTPRFSGNGVSLTLGLPHCENLPLSAAQQTYLSNPGIQLGRGLEIGGGDANNFCGINTAPPPSHSTTAYESINMQNRKRFAAQLLPDFVA